MAIRRHSLLVVAGLTGGAEPAPVVPWGWRECGCGVVFYGPASRTRCMVCRTGFEVVRVGLGRAEDDEEASEDMARPLGIDRSAVAEAMRLGTPAAALCVRLGLNAAQFAGWCYRQQIRYPGVPVPQTQAVDALQDEIDRLLSVSPSTATDLPAQAPRIPAYFANDERSTEVRGSKDGSGLSVPQIAANAGRSAEGGDGVVGRAVAEPVLAADAAGAAEAEGVIPEVVQAPGLLPTVPKFRQTAEEVPAVPQPQKDGEYESLARGIGALVDRKQREYGDSFHRCAPILRALWPNGIPPEAYTDALAVVRVVDKLFRIAAGKQGDENPWRDIAGYGLLGAKVEGPTAAV